MAAAGGLVGEEAMKEIEKEIEKNIEKSWNERGLSVNRNVGPLGGYIDKSNISKGHRHDDDTGNGLGSFGPSDPLGGIPGDSESGDDTGPGYESDPLGGIPGDSESGDDTGPGYESDPLGGNPNDPDAGDDTGPGDPGGGDNGGSAKPIVLDLDGDGVELVALEDSTAFYDINGDGYRERMAWASADDGFLAYDKDGDGNISAHDELSFVSYVEGAQTDLEGLAHFDTNGNGQLDSGDSEWSKFRVWQDLDRDGESDPGELRTLAEAGIASILLASDGGASYTDAEGSQSFCDMPLRHYPTRRYCRSRRHIGPAPSERRSPQGSAEESLGQLGSPRSRADGGIPVSDATDRNAAARQPQAVSRLTISSTAASASARISASVRSWIGCGTNTMGGS